MVVRSSSEDGPGDAPEPPPGTAELAGDVVDAGAAVVAGAVELAVGGTVPAGTDELPGAVVLAAPPTCETPGAEELASCAEAGTGAAAARAAQQIPSVRWRRRIRPTG
jgi:hypothetical protein